MKRSGSLRRKTPLRTRTPLVGGGPLQRSARLTRTAIQNRRRQERRPEEVRARQLLAARSLGVCEGCGQRPATDWAHRVARSQQGLWCPSNGLHLCSDLAAPDGRRGCHERAHASPTWARERGWILRSTDDPLTFPALLARHGRVQLRPDGSVAPVERNAA